MALLTGSVVDFATYPSPMRPDLVTQDLSPVSPWLLGSPGCCASPSVATLPPPSEEGMAPWSPDSSGLPVLALP